MAVNKITHSWNEDYTGLIFTGSQRQPTLVEVRNYCVAQHIPLEGVCIWTAKTQEEAVSRGNSNDAKAYAAALPVTKSGNTYTIEVINPVEYASYVEFGHRTRGGNGWVNGQYFLTLSERDLERLAPAVIERKLELLLREVFNV